MIVLFCPCALKGIYRVNGAKSRVEKLCQAFENGKDLVELSDLYPHDISNVLKLYLRQVGFYRTTLYCKKKTKTPSLRCNPSSCLDFPRQLPEPLIQFRFYNELIGLAKETQSVIVEELEALRLSPTPVPPAQNSVEMNRVLLKMKDLLKKLPPTHYKTLQFLIEHLHR